MRKRATLSLSGSGHLLIYQLGACRTLLSHGIAIRHVVGASGGAIAAAVVAAQLPLEDYAQAFIQQKGGGMKLLEEFWDNRTTDLRGGGVDAKNTDIVLHIATTRCSDVASKVFSFPTLTDREKIFDCIRASCLIPPTFHPLDILSTPSPYPDHHGIPIDDPIVGMEFYVDGGISTPAPMIDLSEFEADEEDTRIIISPVAGTSQYTARISPPLASSFWPQIETKYDLGLQLSWSNLKALRAATGNVSSTELHDWYMRGQDDANRFLESSVVS